MASENNSETPEQLYTAAITFVEQGEHENALEKAQHLLSVVKSRTVEEVLPALNLLGEINVELGDVDAAKGYFEQAVVLDPEGVVPEAFGGGAEKFLWLAQLCDEGGKQSVSWFEKGVKALQNEISVLENGGLPNFDPDTLLLMRLEKKKKLANALCGIVEVYMTDLSWEDDAEARCERLVTEAMSVEDETSPEVLQTLASVRLSQERTSDARSALAQSIASWTHLEPEDPGIPDFPTRISLARLLMEADMEIDAKEVLSRLVQEDDQSVEAWYLGGWCQYLIADQQKTAGTLSSDSAGNGHDSESVNLWTKTLKGSRRWLKMAVNLYEALDYEDERLLDHAEELITGIDTILGPEAAQAAEADEESEDEWEGIVDEEDADEEMQDA